VSFNVWRGPGAAGRYALLFGMEQLLASWKRVLSFLKREWTLRDYPIRVKKQAQTNPEIPKYSAQIINWWTLTGLGNTKEEALRDLQNSLENFKRNEGYLPRPGTRRPIEFAPTLGIDSHAETARRFIEEVLGFGPNDPVFISDQSSLYDFDGINGGLNLDEKITEVFGVEVSDIEDRNLVRIFERIDRGV
jgi:hypothetical protein